MLRGLLMLLMAIDHTRDFFSRVHGFDPTDPERSWPALFLTRWVTHLCAPGFIALAGASVFLQRHRGKSAGQMSRLLLTRGLWLVLLEVTLIDFGWSFAFAPALQVIWAIGVSMVFLATLQWLPTWCIGAIGASIVVLHNLLDGLHPAGIWWLLVHQQGPILAHGQMVWFVLYPVVPWIGVIAMGYAFGPVALLGPERRERMAAGLGMLFLAAFAALRLLHGYGDAFLFHRMMTPAETAMSFLEVEKYPPSLQYLLGTLGVLLLVYAVFDRATERGWLGGARRFVETFGRVPFFYYVLHIYLLHTGALLWTAARGMNWRFWLKPGAVFLDHLDGWGYSLPTVYLVWALVVLLLYWSCRWFAGVKARRRDWWLSYL